MFIKVCINSSKAEVRVDRPMNALYKSHIKEKLSKF